MEDELKELVDKWLLKAGNDYKTALQGFEMSEIITDSICFHCQQAAEKYLKAYLVCKNIIPEKTHKIEQLLENCLKFDADFEQLSDSVLLTEYAVALRYPDDFFIPDIEEAKEALALAENVRKFVLEHLK